MNDAEIEAAVRAELPWLLERRQAGERAAAEDTVSGRLRRAIYGDILTRRPNV